MGYKCVPAIIKYVLGFCRAIVAKQTEILQLVVSNSCAVYYLCYLTKNVPQQLCEYFFRTKYGIFIQFILILLILILVFYQNILKIVYVFCSSSIVLFLWFTCETKGLFSHITIYTWVDSGGHDRKSYVWSMTSYLHTVAASWEREGEGERERRSTTQCLSISPT